MRSRSRSTRFLSKILRIKPFIGRLERIEKPQGLKTTLRYVFTPRSPTEVAQMDSRLRGNDMGAGMTCGGKGMGVGMT